jgi:hypothetical protein
VSCESAWKSYRKALRDLRATADRLEEYAAKLGGSLGENPANLIGGELNSWKRYAAEAAAAAARQRDALDAYIKEAREHR